MSDISGVNNFVIEGGSHKRLYNQFIEAMDKCVEFNKEYALGKFKGKRYAIRKENAKGKDNNLPNYWILVFKGKDCIAGSCFDKSCVKHENGSLYFTEEWCNSNGGFEIYVVDSQLYKEQGFYFETYSDEDMAGYTNDAEGRHFKPSTVYYGVNLPDLEQQRKDGKITEEEYLKKYKKAEAKIMGNFNALSPEEQLAFCEARKDEIFYEVTEVIDFEEWMENFYEE